MNKKIKKIRFGMQSIIAQIYHSYQLKNATTSSQSSYVISLTSYHKRLKTLHITCESLLRQSLPPKSIYVWLSEEDIKKLGGIPKKMRTLESRGIVIKVKSENIYSYKKLSYFNEINISNITHILTADDDIIYPKYWAEKLIEKSNNDNCVSCFRGHNVEIINNYFDYNKFINNNTSENNPVFNLIPTGCSGIAYPINSLDNIILNKDLFLSLAPKADDLWYKAATLKKQYKCARVEKENIHFPIILSSIKDSLYSKNVFNNENNQQLKNIIYQFNLSTYFTNEHEKNKTNINKSTK
ncbi:hypothetical protein ACQSMR_003145 [Morganella morganii]|uniref:hypothetical protein n=2 Tax=Morganella morganii TaxID=582 RepID=UPI001EFBDC57|nr:hypothetical protein [Morganella morganii]